MADAVGAEREPRNPLLATFSRAMRATARQKREELVAQLVEGASSHVAEAWLRGAADSKQLTTEAEREIDAVYRRTESLIRRIRRDAEHEIDLHRGRLARSLGDQVAVLNAEIEATLSAVEMYHAALDRFFDRVDAAVEPLEILDVARGLPSAPDLEAIRERARAQVMRARQTQKREATSRLDPTLGASPGADHGDRVVGVMEKDQIPARPREAIERGRR